MLIMKNGSEMPERQKARMGCVIGTTVTLVAFWLAVFTFALICYTAVKLAIRVGEASGL